MKAFRLATISTMNCLQWASATDLLQHFWVTNTKKAVSKLLLLLLAWGVIWGG